VPANSKQNAVMHDTIKQNATMPTESPFLRVWLWPIILAALSLFGLLSALLGQGGVWWTLSWITLTAPLLVILWCYLRKA